MIVAAHRSGGHVHNAQLLGKDLVEGEGAVEVGGGVLVRVAVIDAVDRLGQKNAVCIHLNRTQRYAGIS